MSEMLLAATSGAEQIFFVIDPRDPAQDGVVVTEISVQHVPFWSYVTRTRVQPIKTSSFLQNLWDPNGPKSQKWIDIYLLRTESFSEEVVKQIKPFLVDVPRRKEPKVVDDGLLSNKSLLAGILTKAGRRPLRQEPYDPDARDGDNDGIVQEGTPWERPAGTRFLNSTGEQFTRGYVVVNRPKGKLVDADGNEVDYTPTYERAETGTIGAGRQIGQLERQPKPAQPAAAKPGKKPVEQPAKPTSGTPLADHGAGSLKEQGLRSVRETAAPQPTPVPKPPATETPAAPVGVDREIVEVQGSKKPKSIDNFSAKAEGEAQDIGEEEFERKTLEYQKKAAGDPEKKTGIWKRWSELKLKVKGGGTVTVDRRKVGEDENDFDAVGIPAQVKIVSAHLVATRMRELGYDPSLIYAGQDLWIHESGRLVSVPPGGEGHMDRLGHFLIDPTDPNYQELLDEASVSHIIHRWTMGSSMVGTPMQRALQDAANEVFGLNRETVSKPDDDISDEIKKALRGFMEASYSRTQEALEDMGINEVRVHRGFTVDLSDVGIENLRDPKTVEDFAGQALVFQNGIFVPVPINLRPLSSFATDEEIAGSFSEFDEDESASVIISGVIPRERVVSFPGSGLGCLGEAEFVVRGPRENESDFFDADFPYFSPDITGKNNELYNLRGSGTAYDEVFNPEMFEPDEEFDPKAYYDRLPLDVQAIIDGISSDAERQQVLRDLWEEDL